MLGEYVDAKFRAADQIFSKPHIDFLPRKKQVCGENLKWTQN